MEKKGIMLISLLLVCSICLVGCVPKQSDTTNDNEATATQTKKRDTVNLCINMALSTVDPHGNRAVQDLLVLSQIYEGLYKYDDLKGKFEPRIAESYTISEDGKVYTFKLNPKCKFHNGDPVKASDVVFSIKRAMSKPVIAGYLPGVIDVVAEDDLTVKIILKEPNVAFMSSFVEVWIISEKEVTAQGDEFGTKVALAGTGPYYLTYLDQDVKWTLQAFPDYYRGEPSIKTINYRPINDNAASVVAFEAGELDWYNLTTATSYEQLKTNPNYKTEVIPANHITFICIEANVGGPLSNKLVRQAIAYSIDKEAMNQAAFNGLGTVADFMENPKYNLSAPSKGIVYDYNPEKAKELLKEAGYPNGCHIGTLLGFTGSHFEKCAQVAQAYMAAVGITCDIEWIEQAAAVARWNAPGDFEITVSGYPGTYDYSGFRRRWDTRVKSAFSDFTTGRFNVKTWENLLDEASTKQDLNERTAIHQKLNDLIMEEAIFIPLLYKPMMCVWNKDLNVVNRSYNYDVFEWSWNN